MSTNPARQRENARRRALGRQVANPQGRESWVAINVGSRTLTIGDIDNIPAFEPSDEVDLLRFSNKEIIEDSSALKSLISSGDINIRIVKDGVASELSGQNAINALTSSASGGGGGSSEVLIVRDEKDSTVTMAGGVFTFNAWRTRDLNTVQYNGITGASLSTNQVTLPAGTYHMRAEMPARGIQGHKGRIYNVTDAEVLLIGQDTHLTSGGQVDNAIVEGVFELNGEKVIEFQHHSETDSASSTGFGVFAIAILASAEVPAVYSMVTIQKIG